MIPLGDPTLVVSELFGPTFQGEGPSAGRLAKFLRLGGCNLSCSWCDTPYSWNWSRFDPAVELTRRSVDDVLAELDAIAAPMLVITGGEPLLQQRQLIPLVTAATERQWRIEVETNGTIAPLPELAALVDQWNVSPKLAGSGVAHSRRSHPPALKAIAATGRAVAKFVVSDVSELDEVDAIADAGDLTDIWVMPEATDAGTLTRRLAELAPAVLARGWNLSSRLHVLVWGDRRGV